MSVAIQRATAAQTFPLRHRVLRPHDTVDELSVPDEDTLDTAHFAAVEHGNVIGAASVRREPAPWTTQPQGTSWRLRGMATAEGRRSQGIGAAVLAAALEHVANHGGGLVWCNARVRAVAFYERGGFVTRGERWDDPTIGPHIAMERLVESATP
jgi:predicted GNAT family N-acyltransferase